MCVPHLKGVDLMSTFYLDYNVTGDERKRLVKAIAAYTQADAKVPRRADIRL